MNPRNHDTKGFTIVELLIVIVVIGILASISIVTFSTIQKTAYNSRVVSGVRQYVNAINGYYAMHGSYPLTSIEEDDPSATIALTCLGVGYKDNQCGTVTGTIVYEDALFNSQMKDVLNAPPALGENTIAVGDESFVGAVYGIDHVIGHVRGRTIQYALTGTDQPCVLTGAYGYNISTDPPTTACEILLEPMD